MPLEIGFWCDFAARRNPASSPMKSWKVIYSVNNVIYALHIRLFKRIAKGSKSDVIAGYDQLGGRELTM